jgi:hypothetical protein
VKAEMRSSGLSIEEIQDDGIYKKVLAQVEENEVERAKQSELGNTPN